MAIESTAINDLIGQVRSRPLSRDARDDNDWMFGEEGDATEIDPMFVDPTPQQPRAPSPVVPLPQPYAPVRTPRDRGGATQFVRKSIDWGGTAKLMILPIGLFAIVIVLLGVYFAKKSSTPPASPPKIVASARPSAKVVMAATEPPKRAPTVTPIEVAPIEAPTPAKQPVDPGSPASRFLNAPPVEPTILPTGAQAAPPKPEVAPAPAPEPEPEPEAAPPPPAPRAAAKVVKAKTKRAAKRAAKRVAIAKKPAKQMTISDDDQNEDETPPPPAVKKDGKGVLAISSTPSFEVWVDGRNSKAMTPLRVILLSGKHKVTLFDKEHGKAHTFEIEIKADETTKITKSYE